MTTADAGETKTELEPPPLSLKSQVWKNFGFPVSYVDNVCVVDKKPQFALQKLDGSLFCLSFQLTEDKLLLHDVVNECFKFDNVVWYIANKGQILYCIKV